MSKNSDRKGRAYAAGARDALDMVLDEVVKLPSAKEAVRALKKRFPMPDRPDAECKRKVDK